jgi:nucleotide-binding universal stress UspA family protein
MIKSLLVGVDSSVYARAAVEHAIELGKVFGARVTGLHVLDIRYVEMPPYVDYSYAFEPVPPVFTPPDLMDKFRAKGERVLNDLSETVKKAGLAVDIRMEEGVPGQVMAELAQEHDLLVLGKRGEHAKWGRDLLGSTAESITRRSVIPVLLTEEKARPLRKALLLYDGSEPAGRGLRLAADLATSAPVEIAVLTADDDEKQGEATLSPARAYLEPLGLTASLWVRPGRPAKAAAATLSEYPADVVVMGTSGHSGLQHLILGSTAEQLMRSVQTPVLLVP